MSSSTKQQQPADSKQGKPKEEEGESKQGEEWVPVFVNQGLLRWEEARKCWLRHTKNTTTESSASSASDSTHSTNRAAVPLDVDDVIDLIFSTNRWRSTTQNNFQQPVPLPQMVDILTDLWEAEGLDV